MSQYIITRTKSGCRKGEQIGYAFDALEDARLAFAETMKFNVADDYGMEFMPNADYARREIAFTEEAREAGDWDADRCARYIASLLDGIESGYPFCVDVFSGELVTMGKDGTHFYHDTYAYELKEIQ